jgi:DNA-binding NarL/FixJ family response regulator
MLKQAGPDELEEAMETIWLGNTYLGSGLSATTYQPTDRNTTITGSMNLSYEDRFVRQYAVTKRELEVLKLIGKAMSNKEIAATLFISEQTASVHRKNIMRKTGVSNSVSLIKMAYDYHLL